MFILTVAASFIIGASAILTALPSNTVVVAGSKVILECRTNTSKKLIWQERLKATEKSLPFSIIFTGNQFTHKSAEKYDIVRESDGQFDLKFNATLDHGNEYICQEPGGYNCTAQLTVLASNPQCYVNGMPTTSNLTVVDEQEYVEFKCNLTFAGRWNPNMEWRQMINSGNDWKTLSSQEITEKEGNIYVISATLAVIATENITTYVCKVRFLESARPNGTTAENIPEYSYNWTSPTFVLRSFYDTSYKKQEEEQKDGSLEFQKKDVELWPFVSLILAVLLVISISVTIFVILRFTVCPRETQSASQHPEDISLPVSSSVNVDSFVNASTDIRSEWTPISMVAYEEVAVIEPCADTVAAESAIAGISSDKNYTVLVQSDITSRYPHSYETINLPQMTDDTNTINIRTENEPSDVRMGCLADYVNI